MKRLLAYAHAHDGKFTSRAYQKLVSVDLYTASRDIKDLMRKGIARLTKRGGRMYEILASENIEEVVPKELKECLAQLPQEGYLTNSLVQQILGAKRVKATRLLNEWVTLGLLEKKGQKRWTQYYATSGVYESPSKAYESPSPRTCHKKGDS